MFHSSSDWRLRIAWLRVIFSSDINGMDPDVVSNRPFRNIGMSKAALTHRLRKLRTPAKCRECDSYVYFQGAECEEVSSSSLKLQGAICVLKYISGYKCAASKHLIDD